MLNRNKRGYAVMTEDLDGYCLEHEDLEICKEYCRKGYVIVEQIPYTIGFSISITWRKFYKPFQFNHGTNILWLHFSSHKEKRHKNGKIVFTP